MVFVTVETGNVRVEMGTPRRRRIPYMCVLSAKTGKPLPSKTHCPPEYATAAADANDGTNGFRWVEVPCE